MQIPPPGDPPTAADSLCENPRMELNPAPPLMEDPSSTSVWDWNDFLDFTADEPFSFPLDPDQTLPSTSLIPDQTEPPGESSDSGGLARIRKRDPRLTCSNFLAGRIPCACPEIDEKLEEEESGAPWKKRARSSRPTTARCQVRGCEADISELKGYHRRHRVCLRCASASCVLIDGESKRYCQQCGKFHILTDFDEGKRSCRRKLERHNNRRRRRPIDSKGAPEKEPQGDALKDNIAWEGEADGLGLGSHSVEKDAYLEAEDVHVSTLCSAPESQPIYSDSVVSFEASRENQIEGGKDNCKSSLSPSYYDNKSAYSSACPTGRVSFKLFDWNPAEFPRRLRHQIFRWLDLMPVELEGYLRPGCTILTVFLSMRKSMWEKLFEDPAARVHDFVVAPGGMLSGRGNILVHLNNKVFRVVKDGSSVMKVHVKLGAPTLHYVRPACFEAGKPMEFFACGSNIKQPKLRFLVSFAGKYLPHNHSVASPWDQRVGDAVCTHQSYKICTSCTEQNTSGPAFIEVENESGLSNYIPVLIGDKDVCSEVNMLQQRFNASLSVKEQSVAPSLLDSCDYSSLIQTAFSEILLDIAWLLKEPPAESFQSVMTTSQIQRFNCILDFLVHHESTIIFERILQKLKVTMDKLGLDSNIDGADADMLKFLKYINCATHTHDQKLLTGGGLVVSIGDVVPYEEHVSRTSLQDDKPSAGISNQDVKTNSQCEAGEMMGCLTSSMGSDTLPLLDRDVVMDVNPMKEWTRSHAHVFPSSVLGMRPPIFIFVVVAVCFCVCATLLHPQKVSEIAVSIHRRLFD